MEKTVHFATTSREDAIRASTALIDGIDSNRIKTESTKILIIGGVGKSVIFDAIAQHLSDNHTAVNMSTNRFVENAPFAATDLKVRKRITHNGQACSIALTHLYDDLSKVLYPKKKGWLSNTVNRLFTKAHESIYFVTTHHPDSVKKVLDKGYYRPDITIEFKDKDDSWHRDWSITVHSSDILTPVMHDVLDNLNARTITDKNPPTSKLYSKPHRS